MSWLYYLDNIEVVVPYRNAYDSGSRIKRRFDPAQCDIFELDEREDVLETVGYNTPLSINDWMSTESIPGNELIPFVLNIYSKTVLYKTDEGIWIKAVYVDREGEPFAERIDSREAVLEIIAHGHNVPIELLGSICKEWILGCLNDDMSLPLFQSVIRSERKYDELIFTEQRICRRFYHIHSFIKALTNGNEPDYEFPKRLIETQYRWRRNRVSYNRPITATNGAPPTPIEPVSTPTNVDAVPVIQTMIDGLSKEELDALSLYKLGWTQTAIAEQQGVNQSTVSRRLSKFQSQKKNRTLDDSKNRRPKTISVDPSKIDSLHYRS